ncbi:MAG: amidohydrolase family protein [bacterium]|nr:amidohydrolase family protein [bacterium]
MLIVRGAEELWTGSRRLGGVSLVCAGSRVHEVDSAPALPLNRADAEILDASGCVVVPGLVNAHHHLLQTAFRTLPGTRHLSMGDWLAAMAGYYRRAAVDPRLAEAAAAVGVAEGLLAGVTTVADHHFTWPEGVAPMELVEATVATARRLGARLVFGYGSAGDDPEALASGLESVMGRYPALGADGMLQMACGPAGVHSDGPETFAVFSEAARKWGLRRRTQANEAIDVARAAVRYGCRPLALLEEWGWLSPDVTLAHLCGITASERDRLRATGVTATHAPGFDVPMGLGICEVGALIDAGITVGLGTSGGGYNDAGNLLSDARLALQVGGLTERPPTALELMAAATAGSAQGLGRPELGHLEPGAAADLCCYDITGPEDAGVGDPLEGLLWANPGRRPRHVVVAGKVVVRDGELQTADARALSARLRRMMAARLS